jgi:hypothetical protein
MKKLILMLALMMPMCMMAQNNAKNDTAKTKTSKTVKMTKLKKAKRVKMNTSAKEPSKTCGTISAKRGTGKPVTNPQ